MNGRPTLVLGRPEDVMPVACGIALEKSRRPVVVCLREPDDRPVHFPVPAGRHSRELAGQLEGEGLEAEARGSLVLVTDAQAVPGVLVDRVGLLAGEPPVVALLRPRGEEDEALIDRSSVCLVDGVREPAADLLMDEMERRRMPVRVVERRPGLAERLAGAGLRAGRLREESGQASIEAVALMPLLLSVVVAVGQLLAAGAARELAGHSATAGAAALIQGRDAGRAARLALPGWAAGRLSVEVTGRKVKVRIRPPGVPGIAGALEARASADAGPAP